MPMTREQAETLMRMNPRLAKLAPSREAALARLMRDFSPEQIPVGAPAMGVPAPTGLGAMGGPEIKPVTPAAPAPMKPGVPVMAPRPEATQVPVMPQPAAPAPAPAAAPAAAQPAKFTSPYRAAAEQALKELNTINAVIEDLASKGQEAPPEAKIRLNQAEQTYKAMNARAAAEEAAQIDPERAAAFARQEANVAEERGRLEQDVKRSPWDALVKGGLAMMNPQRGVDFIAALGAGLGSGLDTYNEAKAKFAEQRARLNQTTDQIALQRIDALERARAAAREAIASGEQVDERTLRMAGMTRNEIIGQGTQEAAIIEAKARASKAQTDALYAGPLAQSEIDYRRDMGAAARERGSGGDGVSATTLFNASEEAKNKAIEYQGKVRDKFQAWKESEKGINNERSGPEWDAYMAELRTYKYLRKRAGLEGVLPDLSPKYKNKPNPAPKAAPAPRAPAAGRILSSTPIK